MTEGVANRSYTLRVPIRFSDLTKRCIMVEFIGVVTVIALNWVLAASMANESDAEKRRCARLALFATGQDKARIIFATKNAA